MSYEHSMYISHIHVWLCYNKRMSGDHPNYSIDEVFQNTVKSTGDLKRITVSQTPVKDHQLTLVLKTR